MVLSQVDNLEYSEARSETDWDLQESRISHGHGPFGGRGFNLFLNKSTTNNSSNSRTPIKSSREQVVDSLTQSANVTVKEEGS
jgi:hypothetical protein